MNRTVLKISIFLLLVSANVLAQTRETAIVFKSGISNGKLSAQWKKAVEPRMSKKRLDSLASIKRALTPEEKAWQELIAGKASQWNSMRDSLLVPFGETFIPDTVFVMVGFLWKDDGFTFGLNTVCFDVTAMVQNYGAASIPENSERIDRIFAHEFTHLIHKSWLKQNNIQVKTFQDSILWECLYEGIGMYRSMSSKWLPKNGVLPEETKKVMNELVPIFREKMKAVKSKKEFTKREKEEISANLSRGPVPKKWGAFTIAIWLAQEANGNDENLRSWIAEGPEAVNYLAFIYLRKYNK